MNDYVPVINEELLAGFLDEAPEYLAILDEGLMAFEQKAGSGPVALADAEDAARMNEMFRAAHSLKGLGAAMGFDKIRDLTHKMETLFDQVRMGKQMLEPQAIETLFSVFDRLKALVNELSQPGGDPVTIDDSLAALDAILNGRADATPAANSSSANGRPDEATGGDAAESADAVGDAMGAAAAPSVDAAQAPDASNSAASESDGAGPSKRKANMVLDNPDMIRLFVETTIETLDELNESLLELEQAPGDAELINRVFRCAHNIKGATGAAGCDALYRLTHRMETALDLVRAGTIKLDDRLMAAIFSAADRIRSDVDLIRQGRLDDLSDDSMAALFEPWFGQSASPAAAPPDESADTADTADESQQRACRLAADALSAPADNVQRPASAADAETPNDAVDVVVEFNQDDPEAPIQAYLIFNRLRELCGSVITTPDVEKLDAVAALERMTYRVCPVGDLDEIKQAVGVYSIRSVNVVGSDAAPASPVESTAEKLSAEVPSPPAGSSPSTAPAAMPSVVEHPRPTAAQPAAVSPAKEPAGPSGRATPAAAAPKPAPTKVAETIRVDLEKLDQLMNLGGELVINKARLVQIQSRFDPIFQQQNIGYVVEDMADRLRRLQEDVTRLSGAGEDRGVVAHLSESVSTLSLDFGPVQDLVQRVQSCRPAMNDFSEALHSLNRVSEGMQKRIMETRMVSIGPLFQRFRRVVRDIAKSNGKNVELVIHGENTELDKRMIDELGDPLTHMIRNSVDHGIERPEDRIKAGKPPVATVTLDAYHRGRHICIEVRDDGRGVNIEAVKRKILEREMATPAEVERMTEKELVQFIFKPGFSTAEKVTDLSGRGMGMDIVLTKLETLNGVVEVDSVTGVGTTVTIKLPLTLAIITAIIARIGEHVYAVPLEAVAEIITIPQTSIQSIQRRRVVRVRDRVIPVALFEQVFSVNAPQLRTKSRDDAQVTLVILGMQNDKIGLVVDELIGQDDVVIKSISDNYRNVPGITGASIMGDGAVSLILDVASMMSMLAARSQAEIDAALAAPAADRPQTDASASLRIDIPPPDPRHDEKVEKREADVVGAA